MPYIEKDVMRFKTSDGFSFTFNLATFFPANNDKCRRLLKIFKDCDGSGEDIKAECIEYLDMMMRANIGSGHTKDAAAFLKNLIWIGGPEMKKTFETEFAAALEELKKNRDIQLKYNNLVQEAAGKDRKIEDLNKEVTSLESRCIASKAMIDAMAKETGKLAEENADLSYQLEQLKAAYEELKANKPVITLEAPAAAAAEPDTEKASADHKDPETLADLASIDGVELIVNGKQTSSPVSWVYGAEKYRDLLTKLGFKWSAKKSGYWKKGIAA